jgi:hypothetical protein
MCNGKAAKESHWVMKPWSRRGACWPTEESLAGLGREHGKVPRRKEASGVYVNRSLGRILDLRLVYKQGGSE